ncbi:MAG: STAS domain-containing protein [Actinomycetota bacterium]
MDDLARVQIVEGDDGTIVRIAGEVDISNVDRVRQEIESGVDDAVGRHVIDLSETTYLDSSGIRLLFSIEERLRARGRVLYLFVLGDAPIRRILDLADLTSRVTMLASQP